MKNKEETMEAVFNLMNGADPFTGELFDKNHVLNGVEYVRLFSNIYLILNTTKSVNKETKNKFKLNHEMKSKISDIDKNFTISTLASHINSCLSSIDMMKIQPALLNKILLDKGILEVITDLDGTRRKLLKQNYIDVYGYNENRLSSNGNSYQIALYYKEKIFDILDIIIDYYEKYK